MNAQADGIVPTRKEAASRLGITPKMLELWSKEPWFPSGAVGKDARGFNRDWNVDAIRAARDAMGRKGSQLSEAAKKLKLKTDHEKLKQAELETEKRRLDMSVKRGQLIPRDAVELFASTLLTSLGDWCDQLGDLIAADVPKKYRKAVKARVRSELDTRRRQAVTDLAAAARDFDNRPKEGIDGEESPRAQEGPAA